tara:strand:+ start:1530 stop:1724 length:195 start_codon:yes stop_codon:yes gene_type:complete
VEFVKVQGRVDFVAELTGHVGKTHARQRGKHHDLKILVKVAPVAAEEGFFSAAGAGYFSVRVVF